MAFLCSAVGVGGMAASVEAQTAPEVHVGDERTCPQCRVRLSPGTTLGEDRGDGFVSLPNSVVVTDEHLLVVLGPLAGSAVAEIRVFSRAGEFVRLVGGAGDGPGEFRLITGIAHGPGDSLYVVDQAHRRVSVLDPNFDFVRSFPIPLAPLGPVPGVVHAVEEGIWIHGISPLPGMTGRTVHLVDYTGIHLRSVGRTGMVDRHGWPTGDRVTCTPARGGGLWIASLSEYWINRWEGAGDHTLHLVREPEWFTPRGVRPDTAPHARAGDPPSWPGSLVTGIAEDADGLLWIQGLVAPDRPAPERSRNALFSMHSFLEVIDPRGGQVVSRVRHPGLLVSLFEAEGRIWAVEYGEAGGLHPRLTIREIELSGEVGRAR